MPATITQQLLKDLKTQLGRLQDDLRQRASDVAEIDQALRAEYAAATRARRTADTFETWREDPITQAGVAWVLGTVFVRFLEDNGLIEPRLSGVGDNRRFALDRHAAWAPG
jgi:predicted aminopeptidase